MRPTVVIIFAALAVLALSMGALMMRDGLVGRGLITIGAAAGSALVARAVLQRGKPGRHSA